MANIEKWLQKLKEAEKTSIIQDGKRKIHYTFPDRTELAEEYNAQTNEILVRKWKRKSTLGAVLPWEFEIGSNFDAKLNENSLDMKESVSNPIFVRQDTLKAFEWRIRNIPYPIETYQVSVDAEQQSIVIRTTNKKYYKKFTINDLQRINLKLNPSNLTYSYTNNTLIISYEKPTEIIQMEKLILNELKKTKSNKDGDVECNPS